MSERINTPFTNEHFADWCLKMAEKKSPYWYGSCVYKASNSLLTRKSAQYHPITDPAALPDTRRISPTSR